MSITPMWRVDRDGSMFTEKKAAEEHDRMLDLAENFTIMLESNLDIDESLAEEIGLLLSRNKEILTKALKGKPALLQDIGKEQKKKDSEESDSVNLEEVAA